MKRSLKLLMSALAALIVPALGWAALPDAAWTWDGSGATQDGALDSGETIYKENNHRVDVANAVTGKTFTYAFWVKRGAGNWQDVVSLSTSQRGFKLEQKRADQAVAVYEKFDTSGATDTSGISKGDAELAISNSTLTHVVIVNNNGSFTFYLDGTASTTFSNITAVDAWSDVRSEEKITLLLGIGCSYPYNGGGVERGSGQSWFADVKLYDAAFTADQVKELYDDYATRAAAMAYLRTVTETAVDWSATDAWTFNEEKSAAPAEGKPVRLTVDADSTITMNVAATVGALTIDGSAKATFAGTETLTAGSTAINTDVDVSGAKATLGAVTVASGKTLTGSWNQVASAAGEGTFEVTADSTYTNSTIKNILITNGKLTSNSVSGASGIASGRTITVDGAAEGSTAELAITVGDGTGYNNGTDSKIIIQNGAKLCYGVRDTLKTAIELTNGKVELTAEAGNNNRVLDFYNSNDTVADITVKAAEGATAENPTTSCIDCLGTGIHRALHMRAGVVEFNVEANAALDVDGYFVSNAGGGSATGMKKSGDGVMILQGSDASTCATPVEIAAGTIKLCGASTLGTGAITVTGALVYNTSANAEPANTFTGTGTITADSCTVDFTKAELKDYTGTFAIVNTGTLIIPAGKEGEMTIPTDGQLKLIIADDVDEYDASKVTIEGDGSLVFVNSAGEQITDGVDGQKYTRPVSTTPVCFDGMETTYTSIAAAIEAKCAYIMMMAEATEDVTLPSGTTLYTYGVKITGNVTIQSGAVLAVANGGTIDGTLTFDDGSAMSLTGTQNLSVSGAVSFPTSGTFNLTMPSAPVMGNSLAFITAGTALKDEDVTVGKLVLSAGETTNDTDYKLISVSSTGTYEVATTATPSCTLDGTAYGSLAEAITAASAADYAGDRKLVLTTGATLSSAITIDIGDENTLTIDLAGHYINTDNFDLASLIVIESGTLHVETSKDSETYFGNRVISLSTTVVVGTATSANPTLIIGQNTTVATYAYGDAVSVVKGTIGGTGALSTQGNDTVLTMAAGTTIDATEGALTLLDDALLGLPEEGTVTVKVADDAKADEVIINCNTTGLTADMFAVSGAENLKVAIEDGKVVLADATPAEPIVRIGETTYTSLDEALNAIKDEETLTLLADIELKEGLSIEKSITLAIGDKTLTIPSGTTVTVAAEKTLKVTCGAGGLAVDGTIAVNGTLDVSALAYGDTGLLSGKAGSLAIGATGTVKLMSSWNSASVNWMQANNPDFFKGTANGATILQDTVSTTYNGSTWLKADATVTATITANGQTYTEGFATLSAAAAANPSAITLLKDTEVTANATITVSVKGKYAVTVKSGVTLDIATPTMGASGQAATNVSFADGVTVTVEQGAIVKLTSGGGYFNIAGAGTVQAVGGDAFVYGMGSIKNTISANLVIPAGNALNVRAWNDCASLGGGNITVDGSIVANSGDANALKVTVAEGKILAGSGEIEAPVTLAYDAIIDITNGAVTVTGDVTLEEVEEETSLELAIGDSIAEEAYADRPIIICDNAEEIVESFPAPEGYEAVVDTDGTTIKLATAVTYVAQVGETKHETLQAAYEAAATGATITLLGDTEAPGIKIEKSIILDLNGKTLTLTPPPVGSTGTETLGMQILQSTETITIMDGTIDVCAENADAEKQIKMLIQNYSQALTLTNVTLDGTNLVKPTNMPSYVLSNNQGTVELSGTTTITAPTDGVAFDVCKYASYTPPTVTLNTTGTITGTVEVSGGAFTYTAGTIDGEVILSAGSVKGIEPTAAEGKVLVEEDGVYTVVDAAVEVNGVAYATLQEAYDAATAGATITLLGDTTGAGLVINKAITIDFNGFTYTVNHAVGSSSTQTLGMQINAATILTSTATAKGKLTCLPCDLSYDEATEDAVAGCGYTSEKPVRMLINNYADLTVTNVILDGSNLAPNKNDAAHYVLSNNSGDVTIGEGTEIKANDGDFAFDVCKYASHTPPTVTVADGAVIDGTVEVTGGTLDNQGDELEVVIASGTVKGEVTVNEASTYLVEVNGVYCSKAVDADGNDATDAAKVFTDIATEAADGVATVAWQFGISEIVRSGDTVTITAKVTKADATTAAGFAESVKVTIYAEGTSLGDATVAAGGTATLTDVAVSAISGKKLTVKASK